MVYAVPVVFSMYGKYKIEANSLKEAIKTIEDYEYETGLPDEYYYVDDSLIIDKDILFELYPNECDN